MGDIFISYKQGSDAHRAEALVEALRRQGFSVWWDRDIPPKAPWEATIEKELREANLVVVCWSRDSVHSEAVKSEARWAKERNKLLQVLVTPCEPPLFFGEHQGIQIYSSSDLYGPPFQRLVDAARRHIDAALPPELAAAAEKLRSRKQGTKQEAKWRRDEPAQPWEASQFGFTLSLLSSFAMLGLLGAFLATTPSYSGPQLSWLLPVVSGAAVTPLAAMVGGWAAYAMLAQFPRRVGFFSAIFLSLTAGIVGALVPAAVAGVVYPLGQQPDYSFPLWSAFLGLAGASIVAGFVLTRLWTPIYLGLLRKALNSGIARAAIALLAFAVPAAGGAYAWWGLGPRFVTTQPMMSAAEPAPQAVTLNDQAEVIQLASRKGVLRGGDFLNATTLKPEAVARIRAGVGLTGDAAGADLRDRLMALPDDAEFVLAADGSGDATTLAELEQIMRGPATVKVRPGVYRDPPVDDTLTYTIAPEGSLAKFFNDAPGAWFEPGAAPPPAPAFETTYPAASAGDWRIAKLAGEGDRSKIVFELSAPLIIHSGQSVENVTLKGYGAGRSAAQTATYADGSPRSAEQVVELRGTGVLQNASVVGRGGHAMLVVSDAGLGVGAGRPRGSVRNNTFSGDMRVGVYVTSSAAADIIGNRIDRPNGNSFCIYVESLELMAVRGNDLTRCALQGRDHIWSYQSSAAKISDNLGARDVPIIEKDREGVNDKALY